LLVRIEVFVLVVLSERRMEFSMDESVWGACWLSFWILLRWDGVARWLWKQCWLNNAVLQGTHSEGPGKAVGGFCCHCCSVRRWSAGDVG
jgi:hypothetical protein